MVVKISRTQGMATCLAIWMSGAMVGLPWSGWAQGSAGNVREAEVPETRAISSTNGVPALPAQRFDALRRLEEQLNQSLKRFAPRNESEGVGTQIRPNPQPAVIDRRSDTKLKDAFDRKKNWGFMGLEEMMGLPKSEEAYGETEESGSNPKTKRSLIEQYYESLGKKGPGQDSALKTDDRPLGTANSSKNEESLPPRLRETQNNLRKIFDNDGNGRIFESTPEHSSASDIFGLGSRRDVCRKRGYRAARLHEPVSRCAGNDGAGCGGRQAAGSHVHRKFEVAAHSVCAAGRNFGPWHRVRPIGHDQSHTDTQGPGECEHPGTKSVEPDVHAAEDRIETDAASAANLRRAPAEILRSCRCNSVSHAAA